MAGHTNPPLVYSRYDGSYSNTVLEVFLPPPLLAEHLVSGSGELVSESVHTWPLLSPAWKQEAVA